MLEEAMEAERGMTLIEVIIVLAILAILAGALTPFYFQRLNTARELATREEIRQIYEAILGNPLKGVYGYAGDMGRLPNNLQELNSQGNQSSYQVYSNGIGMGWRGPYANIGFYADDYLLDAWGNSYDYGIAGTGQIRSPGQDGQFNTGDDLVYPSAPTPIYGNIHVTVYGAKKNKGGKVIAWEPNPSGASVTGYFPLEGEEAAVAADGQGYFMLAEVPQGIHALKIKYSNVTQWVNITSQGIGQTVYYRVWLK